MTPPIPVPGQTPNRRPVGNGRSGESSSRSREGHRGSPVHRARRPSTWAGSGTATAVRRRVSGSREPPAGGHGSARTPAAAFAGSWSATSGDALTSDPTGDVGDGRREFGPGARFGRCHNANEDVTRRDRCGVHGKGISKSTANGVALHGVTGGRRNGKGNADASVVRAGRPRGPGHVERARAGANTRPREGAEAARAMHAAQPAQWR